MSHESFTGLLALVGIVVIVSSLLSGAVERTGLPLVVIFLLVGAALGPAGFRVVELGLDSPTIQVIATLALLLVLFSDAIGADTGEVRKQRRLAALILGPGTLLPAAIVTLAAWVLLDLSLPAAAIQFALGHPAVATVCTGARSADQVVRNAELFDVPIPDGLWSALSAAGLLRDGTPTPA